MKNTLQKLTSTASGVTLVIIAVVSLNVIASQFYGRVDATEDGLFSLSDGTKDILKDLDKDVTAKFYFSRSLEEVPVAVETYARRVEEILREYEDHSGGRLTVEVIDPKPDTDAESWAKKYGIRGARMPEGHPMYLGVVFLSGDKEQAVPYLDPRKEPFLEYDLTEALVSLFREEKPKVGILSSLPVLGDPNASPNPFSRGQGQGGEPWALVKDLKKNFQVERVETDAAKIAKDMDLLIVIHPKSLPPKTLYAIDQHVMRGGRLLAAVDPMSRVDLAKSAQAMRRRRRPPDASSDLGPLFQAWHLDYNPKKMVGDPALSTQINAAGAVMEYPYFLTLGSDSFSDELVVTASLEKMVMGEAGSISSKADSPYTFEPLIETTESSGTVGAMMAGFTGPRDLAAQLEADDKKHVIAARVRGKFASAYPDGPPPPPKNANKKDEKSPERPSHVDKAKKETSVIIVADTDFLHDRNAVNKLRFGGRTLVRVKNDNLNFLYNSADFMGGSQELISIRSSGRISRPFDRVAELKKNAQKEWKAEEKRLTEKLRELEKKLAKLQNQRTDGNRLVLSSEQEKEIEKFREEKRNVRERRREVRKNLRQDIEALGRRLIAANLLIVPLIVAFFGMGVFWNRSRRMRQERNHAE